MPESIFSVTGREDTSASQLRKNVVDSRHAVWHPQESLIQGFGVYADTYASIGLATTRRAEIHGLGSLTDSMTPSSSSRRSSAPTLSRTPNGRRRRGIWTGGTLSFT